MASLLSCIAAGAAWCCCTATASLMNSCCGNDKPSSEAPSAASGRKRSVLLLILAGGIALVFQYGIGPRIVSTSSIPSNFVTDGWKSGCTDLPTVTLQQICVGNHGAFRATASAVLFFLLAALAAICKPTANREAWPAKYILFVFLCLATCFVPSDPWFSDVFLWIARAGGVLFIVVQQIVILDLAWNWNESWVEKSNRAESDQESSRWLGAILFSCSVLYTGSIVAIIFMFIYFNGCGTNEAFVSLTLIFSILLTVAQLRSAEGSLLSSAVVVSYGTYLCYTAVVKNPNGTCNPFLGEQDVLGVILGIVVATISLAWTGWSTTAVSRIDGDSDENEELGKPIRDDTPEHPDEERVVQGVVTNDKMDRDSDDDGPIEHPETNENKQQKPVSWRINIMLAMVSCWLAMALTGWGSVSTGGNAANPSVGRVSMWMIIASQWVMFIMYGWTLVAPQLFPGRDFS